MTHYQKRFAFCLCAHGRALEYLRASDRLDDVVFWRRSLANWAESCRVNLELDAMGAGNVRYGTTHIDSGAFAGVEGVRQ